MNGAELLCAYSERLDMPIPRHADKSLLFALHKKHMLQIPFENLDIQHRVPLSLEQEDLIIKVLKNQRGGFCYELNYLFSHLLKELHFRTRRISARVYSRDGVYGPEFDHMALCVEMGGKRFLLDVGFGHFSQYPLKVELDLIQDGGDAFYRICRFDHRYIRLERSTNGKRWVPLYLFNLVPRTLEEFIPMFRYHQHSPESIFTKGLLVTKRTEDGRVTITDGKLIRTDKHDRKVNPISEKELSQLLDGYFGLGRSSQQTVL